MVVGKVSYTLFALSCQILLILFVITRTSEEGYPLEGQVEERTFWVTLLNWCAESSPFQVRGSDFDRDGSSMLEGPMISSQFIYIFMHAYVCRPNHD